MRPPAVRRFLPFLLLLLLPPACGTAPGAVRTGADRLGADPALIPPGLRIGLITNHTGRLTDGTRTLDALLREGIRVTALFSPEHGVAGTAAAGAPVGHGRDSATGVPVYSLHGEVRAPTAAMLEEVDALVYDLQDAGVRFYTYISTMKLCMDAAAARGLPFIVLDRPDPQGGLLVDGPVLPDSLRSFLGAAPLPVVYGLTCGELARMLNGEGMLDAGRRVELTVIPLEGWRRGMTWEETGLPWPVPSPNLRTPEAVRMYPVTCYLEATAVSEGRGTPEPFLLIGAPFLDGVALARVLAADTAAGLAAEPVEFTPASSKHAGRRCSGVRLRFRSGMQAAPVETGVRLLAALAALAPESLKVKPRAMDLLLGDPGVRAAVAAGSPPGSGRWSAGLEAFRARSLPYRLYP